MGRLDAAEAAMIANGMVALEQIGQHLLGEGQRDAPIEEGTLRASGRSEVKRTPRGAVVEVTFSTVYAARQHEETTWRHPRGGRAKYLEAPAKANAHRYEDIMRRAVLHPGVL